MKEIKEQYFINNFNYYSGLLKISRFQIERDNRIDCECQVEYTDRNKVLRVSYNSDKLNLLTYNLILASVLHEIGHIIQNLPTRTFKQTVRSEYCAEDFALKYLKEHKKRAFLEELKWITKQDTFDRLKKVKTHKPHLVAFQMLKRKYKEFL
jgi:hypothetical protein